MTTPTSHLTERAMLDLLHARYGLVRNGNGIRYVLAEHVKNAAGFNANRILDMVVQDLYPSTNCELIGHEVKVSHSDWLVELKDSTKAGAFLPYMDRFFLVVADKDIVQPGELPEGWGLMAPGRDGSLRVVKGAVRHTPAPLPREMQAALSRAVYKTACRQQQAIQNLELISDVQPTW